MPQGSFFALLGASGCGKTTTLRMIAGLEEPSSGTVFLGDQDVTHLPPYKRPVNTVFQSYALFPHLDIFENVAFGLRRRGIKSVKKQVEEMLDLVQLGEQARKKPHQLSGGQQQRVAVARALINHPKVLLLDEPLGALDLKLRRQMQLELKRIQTEVGITFIHVTHDQEEAMTMADTVAVMNAGRVEQLGSPADLYENPHTTFVANFLGTSNLIEAEVDSGSGDDIVLKAGGGKLVLPEGALLRADDDRRQGAGRGPPGEDLPHPRRRRGRDPRGPQPDHRQDRRLQLHRRLHAVRHRQRRSAPSSRSTPRTSTATPGWFPAPRSSCTGTRRTPSGSTPPRTSTPVSTRRGRGRLMADAHRGAAAALAPTAPEHEAPTQARPTGARTGCCCPASSGWSSSSRCR